MADILTASEKLNWHCVEFSYDDPINPPADPTYSRFVDWSSDMPVGPNGQYFYSTPSMAVKISKYSATLNEQPSTVVLPFVAGTFTDLCSRGEPFSAIWVSIWEVTTPASGDTFGTRFLLVFRGRVSRITQNPSGRHESVEFEITNDKGRMRTPLGLICGHHCVWNFTGTGCNLSGGLEPILQTGLVTAISQRNMTVTGTTPGTASPDHYFQRGYVLLNGLYIQIFDWNPAAPTIFIMNRQPPAAWVGQHVTIAPGCDKTIETCRLRWNNEQHFGGIGYAIPAYNPLIDQPPA
jgi:Phage conserved hypothetical protein BR0599